MKEFYPGTYEGKISAAQRMAEEAWNSKAIRQAISMILEADITREDMYRLAFIHGLAHAMMAMENGDLIIHLGEDN